VKGENMKRIIKTIIAFTLLAAAVIVGLVLSFIDRSSDVYPGPDTTIRLYGESHGQKAFYDAELELWKECYEDGARSLFVELPYYTAEFLNIWMSEDSDEIIDQIFDDIKGTASGNTYYNEFFHSIKSECPETVFFGTDVGHQYNITGERYLNYLTEKGLEDSENYRLAKECIDQGIKYYSGETNNGMTPVRESFMVENFKAAFERRVGDKIMGIYGSYHTDLNNPNLMAGQLRAQYGDSISSVKIISLLYGFNKPYKIGFCVTGLIFLVMLFIPNIYWGAKAKPAGYEEEAKKENKVLLVLERAGEVLVTVSVLIFPAINPCIIVCNGSIYSDWRILLFIAAFVLMILYEIYWIKYFRSKRTLKDMYSSFAGFPLAGASLPVIAVLVLGIYSMNLVIICSAIILGIGHIGIHFMHSRKI